MDASAPLLEQLGRRRIAARSSRAQGAEAGIDGGDVRALRRRAVEDAAPMRGPDQRDRVMGGGGRLLRAASENLEEPPGLTRVAGLAAHWAAAYRHPESCTDTEVHEDGGRSQQLRTDRKSTRLNSSHVAISYAVFCLTNKTQTRLG